MTQVRATQLRALIREALAGQGLPWGGVREGEEWVPGQKTRAGALGRLGDTAEKMVTLNMQLRQLYIDALDADYRSPEYDGIIERIAAVREQLDELEILYATSRAELDKR